jgi:hypothetical protein
MNNYPDINIRVDANGIEYDNKEYIAKRGQQLTWACIYPFTIQFRDVSPLEEGGSPHHESNRLMKGNVKKVVAKDKYKYACAVYANDRVYLDAACPAIIID